MLRGRENKGLSAGSPRKRRLCTKAGRHREGPSRRSHQKPRRGAASSLDDTPLNCGIYFSSSLLATYRTWESTSWKSGFLSLRGKIQQEHNHSSKRKHRDKTQHKTHCLRSTRETLPPSPSPEARLPLRQPGGGGERARVRPRLPAAWFSRMPRRRPSRVCRPRRSAA